MNALNYYWNVDLIGKSALRMVRWQAEWREIYFDSVRFYRETTLPLSFAPRPMRTRGGGVRDEWPS